MVKTPPKTAANPGRLASWLTRAGVKTSEGGERLTARPGGRLTAGKFSAIAWDMDDDEDRRLLRGIIAHCTARREEAERAGARSAEQARRAWAYGEVMRAARELLEEMEG